MGKSEPFWVVRDTTWEKDSGEGEGKDHPYLALGFEPTLGLRELLGHERTYR